MSGFLSGSSAQLQVASMMGTPNASTSVIFVGPPRQELLASEDRKIWPVGMLTSMSTQDSRQNIQQEIVGLDELVTVGVQKGRKVGVMSGLILFMKEDDVDVIGKKGDVWSHFLKNLYKSLRDSHPELVAPFYVSASEQAESDFFVPIAYNDADRWRNFSSNFFSIPIGLYKLDKSEAGKTLEATYYETVKLEGTVNTGVATSQAGPKFEQIAFTYTKAIPMPLDLDTVDVNLGVEEGQGVDSSEFLTNLRSYLGVD